jgi:hypothetical protein
MKILAAKGSHRQATAQVATAGLRTPVWSIRRDFDATGAVDRATRVYRSFSTLTTVGYGDTPSSSE